MKGSGTWEGSEPEGICYASDVHWYPQDVGGKSRQNRGTRREAVLAQMVLVLEVGSITGSREEVSQT